MNTPNKLTLIRVAMIPVFLILLYLRFPLHMYLALLVFIVASATDALDGFLARRRSEITNFGKFMDPLADKLLVMAALIYFVEQGQLSTWVLLVVVAREFGVTALRLVAVDSGRVIAAGKAGKVKTVTTMVCICIMLTPIASLWVLPFLTFNWLCSAAILFTTVWSGAEYFLQNKDILDFKS